MLLIAVAAVGLGWRVNRAHTQARAVAQIKAARGTVWYDYEFDGSGPTRKANASPRAPVWLRRMLGDEYFQEVTAVLFDRVPTDDQLAAVEGLDRLIKFVVDGSGIWKRQPVAGLAHFKGLKSLRTIGLRDVHVSDGELGSLADLPHPQELVLVHVDGITDAGWTSLARMTELRELILVDTGLTAAGARHLAGLARLQVLGISSDPITDEGMVGFENLKALRRLQLEKTAITGAGLAHLAGLPALRDLDLSHNAITDAGLAHLAGLTAIRDLNLYSNFIADAGLAHLAGLTQLQNLDLGNNQRISNAGLAHLAGFTSLRVLVLSDYMITDAGLAHLARLTALRGLDLSGTRITGAGLAHLARLMTPARKKLTYVRLSSLTGSKGV